MPGKRNFETERGRFGPFVFLLILIIILFIGAIVVSWKRWEGQSPEVRFNRDFKSLGRKPDLSLTVVDPGSGLKSLSVALKQKDQTVILVDEKYPGPPKWSIWEVGDQQSKNFDLGKLIAEKYKIQDGPASLVVSATDYSYRNFLRGNHNDISRDFAFDIYPPRLEILSGQHYINQGGSECVVFRVSPDAETYGVQAGPNFFKGYPVGNKDANLKFALFAFAYYLDPKTPL
jgi:hypothetical protein